jgi:hypothetical protein
VTANVNTIRTVLPKSTREAAHSPPRHQTKPSGSETNEVASSPKMINQIPTIVTVDCTSPPGKLEKTNPKMIKEPFLSKPYYRNNNAVLTNSSSDPTNSEEIHSNSAPREFRN